MALAIDTARGDRQLTTTDGASVYNNSSCSATGSVDTGKAWYFQNDSGANYKSMQTEQMYWAVTSKFGMHDSTRGKTSADKKQCPNTKEILKARTIVDKVHISENIQKYIISIIIATRNPSAYNLKDLDLNF